MKLPGWAVDNRTAVRREVADARAAGPEGRFQALRQACAAGAQLLSTHEHPERVLDWVDPLPPSSVALLARLRARRQGKGS